jgi:hypothetical protein
VVTGACKMAVAIVFLIGLSLLPVSAQAPWRAGRERALDSLVQVIVHTRYGTVRRCSGYMFSTNGYVATAYHAVSDATRISIFHPDHGVYEVDEVRRLDTRADVAVLGLSSVDRPDFGGAKLGDHRGLMVGDTVHVLHHPSAGEVCEYTTQVTAIGYPQQIAGSFFAGRYASDLALIQIKGPFDSGSAGGLVLSEGYEVVGMLLGGDAPGTGNCAAHALVSAHLAPLLLKTYAGPLSELRTDAGSDSELFDKFFGPAPKSLDPNGPMPEGYIAWFSPIEHTKYADFEFTHEINDKIDKNWFYAANLAVDGRPLREWSASHIYVLRATVNPWDWDDAPGRYIHFDADSQFSKRIYKKRDTEERIMTRYILAMPLAKGEHALTYENRGANYKSSGIKRTRVSLASAEVQLLDITGLSLVSMVLLPNSAPGVGEGEPVRYELERRPYQDKELNWSIRRARVALKP